jgi:hypothetical protein
MASPPPVQHRHSNRASRAAPLRRSALVVPDSGNIRFDGAIKQPEGAIKQPSEL